MPGIEVACTQTVDDLVDDFHGLRRYIRLDEEVMTSFEKHAKTVCQHCPSHMIMSLVVAWVSAFDGANICKVVAFMVAKVWVRQALQLRLGVSLKDDNQ